MIAKIGIDNINRIAFDKFEKDFSFIVNGKVYRTSSVVANVLSPRISDIFKQNINLSFYRISTKCKADFNRIIQYGEMRSIKIKKKEIQYFQKIFIIFIQTIHNKSFHLILIPWNEFFRISN